VASTETECDRAEIGTAGSAGFNFQGAARPASLLRKSILDLKPAGLCDGWLHCNIQVVCHTVPYKILSNINTLNNEIGTLGDGAAASFEQGA
jgi:hypothetical protein